MKVPTYERQVMPTARIDPNAISGQPVFQANQQLNENVQGMNQQIQQRRLEMQEQKDTQQVLDVHTQMLKEWNDGLYSQETDQDGKPKGFVQQNLGNAEGVTVRFNEWAEGIKQKYAGMLKGENQQKAFDQLFKNAYDSTEGIVVKHEADQRNADQANTYNAYLKQNSNDVRNNPSAIYIKQPEQKAASMVYGKQHGFDEKMIELNQKAETDQLVANAVEPLLTVNNYTQAKEINDNLKNEMSEEGFQKIDKAIKKVKNNVEFDKIADELVKKHGDNLTAGDNAIKAMNLITDEKEELLKTYHTTFTLKQQERTATINTNINKYYTNIEKAGNGAAAFKFIRNLSQNTKDEFQTKQSLMAIASQLYPEYDADGNIKKGEFKTDPNAYWQLLNDVQSGKISTINEMRFKYGTTVSFNDMKSFGKILDNNKTVNGLVTDCKSALEKSKINTPEEQAKFYDYVNDNIEKFKADKGKGPTQEDRRKIINGALTEVIIERTTKRDLGLIGGIQQMLGRTGLKTEITTGKRYTTNLPIDFEMDEKLGYNVMTYNGKIYALIKYNDKLRTGVLQEVITKNGKRQLSTEKQTFAY